MALNPNHTFEDLGDVKCAIVEKNCSQQRVNFLKQLLEFNKFDVVVVNSPPPKGAPKPAAPAEGETTAVADPPAAPVTFTVGVTDVTFSPTNAVFNRELKTPDGEVVTTAYWKQQGEVAKEDFWYWKK